MNIVKSRIAKESYHQTETQKKQIVICKVRPKEAFQYRKAQPEETVHYLVKKTGSVIRYIPDKYWVSHFNENIDENIIFVGLESYGPLFQIGDNFHPIVQKEVMTRFGERNTYESRISVKYIEDLSCCPFNGVKFFERYFDKQLDSLGELLTIICDKNKIPKNYTGDSFWYNGQLQGIEGICGECAYGWRYAYPYPDKRLVDVLKSIK